MSKTHPYCFDNAQMDPALALDGYSREAKILSNPILSHRSQEFYASTDDCTWSYIDENNRHYSSNTSVQCLQDNNPETGQNHGYWVTVVKGLSRINPCARCKSKEPKGLPPSESHCGMAGAWHRFQATSVFSTLFGCLSRRPKLRNKGLLQVFFPQD